MQKNKAKIKKTISLFNKKNIRTSLFIDPSLKDIKIAKELNANCVEIHTGKISNLIKNNKNFKNEYMEIKECSELGKKLGMET